MPDLNEEAEPRTCMICGEEIGECRRRDAVLCRLCARGLRPRTCERCAATFRGKTARYCEKCRRELARERGKRRTVGKGRKGPEAVPATVEWVLSACEEAGSGIITHEGILELRQRLSLSQSELGEMLGRLRGRAYTASYISHLEAGRMRVTEEIQQAVKALLHTTQQIKVLETKVWSIEGLPAGTIILGKVAICPTCRRPFVFPWKTQIYCSRECKRLARNERRRGHSGMERTHCLVQSAKTGPCAPTRWAGERMRLRDGQGFED